MELLNSIYNSTSSRRVLLLLLCSLTSLAQYNTPLKKNLFTLNFSFQMSKYETAVRHHYEVIAFPHSNYASSIQHNICAPSFFILFSVQEAKSNLCRLFWQQNTEVKNVISGKKKKKEIQSAVWLWKQMGTTIRKKGCMNSTPASAHS